MGITLNRSTDTYQAYNDSSLLHILLRPIQLSYQHSSASRELFETATGHIRSDRGVGDSFVERRRPNCDAGINLSWSGFRMNCSSATPLEGERGDGKYCFFIPSQSNYICPLMRNPLESGLLLIRNLFSSNRRHCLYESGFPCHPLSSQVRNFLDPTLDASPKSHSYHALVQACPCRTVYLICGALSLGVEPGHCNPDSL